MARWNSCNVLQIAPDAKKLWQFGAKSRGFILAREQRVPHADALPAKLVAKNWSNLWQPKLNVAWLPPENVFLRVVELPASSAEETFSMVEFQLEKLSPLPVTQIVWSYQVVPRKGTENSQTVVVVMIARNLVEEFLGKLERDGYLADRLEVPMLDQLAAVEATEDGAWIFPQSIGGQNAALVAWWCDGALRNLSFVTLPAAGDRAAELKDQLAHIVWSGELDGWLTSAPSWHLVADPVNAGEWEGLLRTGLNEPVKTISAATSADLAARTANRAAADSKVNLLPPEFAARYRQQFIDRLWLHGLGYAGVLYAISVVIYFCAVSWLGYKTQQVEAQASALSGSYTNSLQLAAEYKILTERIKLKYAALDSWKLVAEQLPDSINLDRFSFDDGQRISLSGTAPADQIDTLFSFNESLQKAKDNGQYIFDQQNNQPVAPVLSGNTEHWNFSLQLSHPDMESK